MPTDENGLRALLEQRLLGLVNELPTSSVGRLGRTALTALRAGRLAWRRKSTDLPAGFDELAPVVASLGQLKGIAMKTGQLLSYLDLALPPELQSALAVLQTHSPAMPVGRVEEILRGELGSNAEPLLARMQSAPVAAASIGQVHRSALPDGTPVAIKVQYPDVEKALAADFRSASLGSGFASLLVPGAKVDDVIGHARRALLEECDYQREADFQERFARLYRGHETLTVPAVHRDYCSRRVLTTSWAQGQRFDDFLTTNPGQPERDRYGKALFEFYVGTLFRQGLYNWDPHPGNYLFCHDGRLTMLDYGSTREFSPAFVRKLRELSQAVHDDERGGLHKAFVGLGMVEEGRRYDFETARSLVRSFYGPMLRDEEVVIAPGQARPMAEVWARKRELLKLHIPGELLFVLRIRFGLMGVLARLRARANWYRLERRFAVEGAEPG
jgi:predicted unusual protein kinase regulating ubiquinone biosynthesis (AarF/ABC1/UbiB family)